MLMPAKHGQTVLLADDDENVHLLMRRAFLKAGVFHVINMVQDGNEAVDYLTGNGLYSDRAAYPLPLLLLLDLDMPGKHGFDVLQWIRAESDVKRMVVVVFSTSDEPGDINRAYDLGANSYLVKPRRLNEFTELAVSLDEYWLKRNRCPVDF